MLVLSAPLEAEWRISGLVRARIHRKLIPEVSSPSMLASWIVVAAPPFRAKFRPRSVPENLTVAVVAL